MNQKPFNPKPKLGVDVSTKEHLNATAEDHNSLGYAEFARRVNLRVPKTRIAEDFNVKSVVTIQKWIDADPVLSQVNDR